jgi:NADPH:quinone reductase-like Zn-dependent oxidoreductase
MLKHELFSLPELKQGEVLLQIHASPINPADLNYIEGTYGIKPSLPAIAGMECFATVIGSESKKIPEGDAVMPIGKIGAWASHAITTADNLIRLPKGIDPLQAAMLKVNPATAWLLLHHFTDLNAGDWVALNASNSGVGQCVIQLAASLGIRTACFLRNEAMHEELQKLGASAVFPDSAEGFAEAKYFLGKERAKLAFNAVGGDSALRLMKLLCESGTHITYGAMGRKPLTVPNGPLIFGDIRIRGLWVTKWIENALREELESTYGSLAKLIAEGALKQDVDSTFPLTNYRQALARLDAKERRGKVLFLNQEPK